jgi:hypothetical protein
MDSRNRGFGLPINAKLDEPIHWYTDKNAPICGNGFHFAGAKYSDLSVDIEKRGACFDCVTLLLDSIALLGPPDGFPKVLSIRVL